MAARFHTAVRRSSRCPVGVRSGTRPCEVWGARETEAAAPQAAGSRGRGRRRRVAGRGGTTRRRAATLSGRVRRYRWRPSPQSRHTLGTASASIRASQPIRRGVCPVGRSAGPPLQTMRSPADTGQSIRSTRRLPRSGRGGAPPPPPPPAGGGARHGHRAGGRETTRACRRRRHPARRFIRPYRLSSGLLWRWAATRSPVASVT